MYNLSITDPYDINEISISGTIKIIPKDNAQLQAIGELTNLPLEWSNPFTGALVISDSIGPIEGPISTGTEKECVDNMIDLLVEEVGSVFGMYLSSRLIATKESEVEINNDELDFSYSDVIEKGNKYIVKSDGKSNQEGSRGASDSKSKAILNSKIKIKNYLGKDVNFSGGDKILKEERTIEDGYTTTSIIIEFNKENISDKAQDNIEPPITKQVIFSVEKDGYMTNDEFGDLKIIQSVNNNIDFIFEDGYDDTNLITGEYKEDDFRGKEEFTTEEFLNTPEQQQQNEEKFSDKGTILDTQTVGEYTTTLPSQSSDDVYKITKVPYYSQYDSRWNRVIYGLTDNKVFIEDPITPICKSTVHTSYEGSNYNIKCDHKSGMVGWSDIGSAGCGITSLTMICNYWAQKNNRNTYTTPIKMAKLSTKTGGRPGLPCNGTNMYSLSKNGYKILKESFGFELINVNASDAKKYVKDGYPVIWGCKSGKAKTVSGSYKSYKAHFMVITEFKNGRFYINDPGNPSNKGCVYTEDFSDISGGSSYFFVSKPI